jgi:hypothetical protein
MSIGVNAFSAYGPPIDTLSMRRTNTLDCRYRTSRPFGRGGSNKPGHGDEH